MKNYDLISVIVPVYKVEKYLNRCIGSIVNQTYKNLEIILIDDGSPDNCPKICDNWAAKDKRIHVIHKDNGGLSDARNAGLKIANGKWISFVDSDDFLSENMLETLYWRCKEDKSYIALCSFMCVDEEGSHMPEMTVNSPLTNELITSEQAVERMLSFDSIWYYIMAHCKLYNRKLFLEILFPKGKLHEDVFVMYKLYEQCQRISIENKACYYYTQRNDSIMGVPYSVRNLDVVEGYIEQIEHFMNNGKRNFASYAMRHAVLHLMDGYNKLDLKLTDNKMRYEELKKQCKEIYRKYRRDIKDNFPIKMRIRYCLFFTNERILYAINNFKNCIQKIKSFIECGIFYISVKLKNNKFIITNTPLHGNIGDAAITVAECMFIYDNFNADVLLLSHKDLQKPLPVLKRIISKKSVVLYTGGGNIGTLWINEHNMFRKCIKTYSNNKIVVFPQTIYFSDDEYGNKILEETYNEMKMCKNLTVCVREQYSYDFLRKNMPSVNVKLLPDMVLYLDKKKLGICTDKKGKKSGLLFCLRKDKEKTLDKKFASDIINEFKKRYPEEEIDYTDTVDDSGIMPNLRKKVLVSKVEQFSKYRCVVTDRLHGMVFAAIAETNCLATACNNYKIAGVYEWFKNNDYIQFIDNPESMLKAFQKIDFDRMPIYDNKILLEEFNKLKNIIDNTL